MIFQHPFQPGLFFDSMTPTCLLPPPGRLSPGMGWSPVLVKEEGSAAPAGNEDSSNHGITPSSATNPPAYLGHASGSVVPPSFAPAFPEHSLFYFSNCKTSGLEVTKPLAILLLINSGEQNRSSRSVRIFLFCTYCHLSRETALLEGKMSVHQ